jgi:tetratricopeptide (TPR) repeat protein
MDNQPKDHLPIGRAALAKAFCADWVSEHSKTILLSFITLIVLSFGLFQVTGKFSAGNKSDYLEVGNAFSAWSADESRNPKIPKSLEQPLNRHPELEAKFGTSIAQRLLALGNVKKAGQYANAALKRARDLTSPYYERFSRNTLLISQGKFDSALDEAKRMKADLEQDDGFWEGRDKFIRSGTALYAYNLVRIAALERELGSKEGELKAWEELVRNAGWKEQPANMKTYDPEAYSLLAKNFSQGDVSLLDYIEQRKKELTQ